MHVNQETSGRREWMYASGWGRLGLVLVLAIGIAASVSCTKRTRVLGSDNSSFIIGHKKAQKSGSEVRLDGHLRGLSDSIQRTLQAQKANAAREKTTLLNAGLLEEQVPDLAAQLKEVKANPDSATAHFELGSCYHRYRVFDKADAEYLKAIQLDPANALYFEAIGRLWRDWGDPQAGMRHLQTALQLNPQSLSAWSLLGAIHDSLGEFDQAITCYLRALDLDRAQSHVHSNLCFTYLQKGRFLEAILHGQEAILLKPDSRVAHNNLGLALGMTGDYSRALEQFQQGGDEAAAHNNLGLVFLKQHKLPEAMEQFRISARLRPFNKLAADNYNLARNLIFKEEKRTKTQMLGQESGIARHAVELAQKIPCGQEALHVLQTGMEDEVSGLLGQELLSFLDRISTGK